MLVRRHDRWSRCPTTRQVRPGAVARNLGWSLGDSPVLVNVGLRAFPEAPPGTKVHNVHVAECRWGSDQRPAHPRVIPWKAMVLGSLILTLVVNIVLWIA